MATPGSNRILLAIVTPVLSVSIGMVGKYLDNKIEKHNKQRQDFEVYYSNVQDSLNCIQLKVDSALKIKRDCKN